MLVALLLSTAHAATLTVDPDDASAYETVQDAVDAAVDGDRIALTAGECRECSASRTAPSCATTSLSTTWPTTAQRSSCRG